MQSYFNRQFDHQLKVLEVGELIDQGVTFPVRCRLSEEVNAIIKYPKNPAGSSVLINEWIGNSIADIIGLTIPRYGCCYLSEEVIEATNCNEEIDDLFSIIKERLMRIDEITDMIARERRKGQWRKY